MAQPTAYTPATDFSEEENDQVSGRSTVRTAMLDAELSALSLTISQIRGNLAILQRDDTALADGVVTAPSLSAAVLALMSSATWTLGGVWATTTVYTAGTLVSRGNFGYVAAEAHTAGDFATDLAAGKWIPIGVGETQVDGAAPNALHNAGFEIDQRVIMPYNLTSTAKPLDRWVTELNGGSVTSGYVVERSSSVPADGSARYALQVTGHASAADASDDLDITQRIEDRDVAAGLKRMVVFSCRIYNGSGAALTPSVVAFTPSSANTWSTNTERLSQASATAIPDGEWGVVEWAFDPSGYTDIDNGLSVGVRIPYTALNSGSKVVRLVEPKLEIGSVRTAWSRPDMGLDLHACRRFLEWSLPWNAVSLVATGRVAYGAPTTPLSFYPDLTGAVEKRDSSSLNLNLINPDGTVGELRNETAATDLVPSSVSITDSRGNGWRFDFSSGISSGDILRFNWRWEAEL